MLKEQVSNIFVAYTLSSFVPIFSESAYLSKSSGIRKVSLIFSLSFIKNRKVRKYKNQLGFDFPSVKESFAA